MAIQQTFPLTGQSPSAPGISVIAQASGLLQFNAFTVHAVLRGAAGGALGVALQREIAPEVWSDWVAFPIVDVGADVVQYAANPLEGSGISEVSGGTNEHPSLGIKPGTCVGGHPGDRVRLVADAGHGTTTGVTQTVYLKCGKLR